MKNLLLAFLLGLSIYGHTQSRTELSQPFQKGAWLIGAKASYGKSFSYNVYDRTYSLIPQVHVGYFVTNKLAVGVSGAYIQEKSTPFQFSTTTYLVGPSVRYQFTRTRVSPFLTVGFQMGQTKSEGSTEFVGPTGTLIQRRFLSPTRVYSRSAGAGVSASLLASLRLEVALGWQDVVDTPNLNLDYGYGRYQAQVGLTYQFGGK